MEERQVWFVTGAARGLGADLVDAALAAGHAVVAAARRPEVVWERLGESARLLVVELDVTSPAGAEGAVAAAVDRFGRIDVLVNNAGASYKGYFEEMSTDQVAQQLAVNLVGPMNVTRAVLPTMRAQQSGLLVMVSSGAGLVGFEYSSVYAASKSGLEGWTSALEPEVAPFGIHTMIVNPGFFRTGLAGPESLILPDLEVADYAERSAARREWWQAQDGHQPGDPALLARAIVGLAAERPTPRRVLAGDDAVRLAEQRSRELAAQVRENRERGLDFSIGSAGRRDPAPASLVIDDAGRAEPPITADEVGTLLGFLDFQRATLEWKTRGLDETGLRVRIASSSLSLAALLKHMAWVEDHWFSYWLLGAERVEPWRSVDFTVHPDWEITSADLDSADDLRTMWTSAVDRSRVIVAEALREDGLDTRPVRLWDNGDTPSLRWIVVHMIEEYARHNGHADLLREAVDGETGE